MPHYVINPSGRIPSQKESLKAVCGYFGRVASLTLSDVASIIDCPQCRDYIRKHERDREKLAMIENAWSPNPKKPVWNEKRKRWVLP